MSRTRLRSSVGAILLLLALPLLGQEEPGPPSENPVTASGLATLELPGRSTTLPFALTSTGPLFALEPLVAILGGQVAVGPLGESRTLTLAGVDWLMGPGSPAMTQGQEITHLSQPAVLTPEGNLAVPLDLLEQTYGTALGYTFRWTPGLNVLAVERRPARDLGLDVDLVHLSGVTTVVLQFDAVPRYRVQNLPGLIEVDLLGDRIGSPPAPTGGDPLVSEVKVGPQRVFVSLAAGAAAESYTLRQPFRLVFDVHRQASSPQAVAVAPTPPQPSRGVHTIVVDPGHGGTETGAIGPDGTAEKELTLQLAESLERRLEARLPVRVILTRDEDAQLPLDTRTALANQNKADLFISLHLNSSPDRDAHGAETYFLSLAASDERAAASAELENQGGAATSAAADPLYGLQLILWDLAQSHHLAESQSFASLVQEELNTTLGLRDRGVKQAPFRVLMGAAMPAVLVELGFLSNPSEEAKLESPAYRADLVDALVRAVARYKAQVAGGAAASLDEAAP